MAKRGMHSRDTKVINLFGAPGSGKSTLAAELYATMKKHGYSVELVREYVKSWAYAGKSIGKLDQLYLCAKQAKAEYDLYGKVDYIITDSPLWMNAFYSEHYHSFYTTNIVHDVLNLSNTTQFNFLIERNHPYESKGRYETETQSNVISVALKKWLTDRYIEYNIVKNVKQILLMIREKSC